MDRYAVGWFSKPGRRHPAIEILGTIIYEPEIDPAAREEHALVPSVEEYLVIVQLTSIFNEIGFE